MRLFPRFFLILFSIALIPVLLFGAWFLKTNERVRANARSLHTQMASLAIDLVEASVADLNRSLAFVEDLEQSARTGSGGELKILNHAAVSNPALSYLSINDQDGVVLLQIAESDIFREKGDNIFPNQKARESGRVTIGRPLLLAGRPELPVVYPLQDGRNLRVLYGLEKLWAKVRAMHAGQGGRILLLDEGGRPLPGMEFGADLKGTAVIRGAAGWTEDLTWSGEAVAGAFATSASLHWKALSFQPHGEAFAVDESFTGRALLFLLALALLAAGCALWLSGRMIRPIRALVEGARRVSNNDLSRPVPEMGWGELNDLSRQFNKMTSVLKGYQDMHIDENLAEKARVEALVHTIPDGIVLADFGGSVLYMNGAARTILGKTGGDVGLKKFFIHDVLREPKLREIALSILRRQKNEGTTEIVLSFEGGPARTYLCRGVLVRREGRDAGILIILRDISTEKEMERMKEEFFQSIVHDLRSPLTAIRGFIEMLHLDKALSERYAKMLGYMENASKRLEALVTDILDTAKIESGTLTLDKTEGPIGDFIEHMRALYQIQADREGITMTLESGAEPSRPLVCDRKLIERVMMNLISNALKFTPEKGTITVRVATGSDGMEFSVKDTGPGIPPDKLEAVFEKFKQLEGGVKQGGGYGLGLAICQKIVHLHGGRIWVESEGAGKGSRFAFRIP